MLDRRRKTDLDEEGVRAKFGVLPRSIPDWLALVGDCADGYPGPAGLGREVGGGGARACTARSRRFRRRASSWGVDGARRATSSRPRSVERRDEALLYKRLATLREDVPLRESLDDLEWRGARKELRDFCARLGFDDFPQRVRRWR